MPDTVVGLFENPGRVEDAVREIEALGFPRQEVRTLREPEVFNVTGVMSFPRVDFEVALGRGLSRIGATTFQTRTYVEGLRSGGALVFATGSAEKLDSARDIMNRHGAVETEEVSGSEPQMPHVAERNLTPIIEGTVSAGRTRQAGGGARLFAW